MDQVVPSDRQGVTVTGHYPNREVRPGCDDAACYGGSAPVDRVESVRVHVVGKAGRAADTGDEDDVVSLYPHTRHKILHGGEDRVVAATGAPTDLLIGLEIGACVGGGHCIAPSAGVVCSTPSISKTFSSISATRNGTPETLFSPTASTRKSARTSLRSWPALTTTGGMSLAMLAIFHARLSVMS